MADLTVTRGSLGASEASLLGALRTGLRAVYQPIVDLADGAVVAYEALARGPRGSRLESPMALFAAARQEGLTAELDLACRRAAVRGALEGGLGCGGALFVNAEPEALTASSVTVGTELAHGTDLQIFVEITERALTLRPAELLTAVERLRAAGFGIALDDVGADRRSLALLPLLRPDLVKLDISLIHDHPSRMSGEVMNGVCAYAESTGATILAEGIEQEHHILAATSLGATLAQGWHYGRPGPLPARVSLERRAGTLGVAPRVVPTSPVELVHGRRGTRIGRKDVLLSVSRALEAQAVELGDHAVLAAAFQDVRHFTPATRKRYRRLASRLAFVAALGAGMSEDPAPGVRGASLAPDDALCAEWNIAVLGPHFAGALVARDLGDAGPEHERRFEFAVTFDRELVVDVAAALISRVTGRSDAPTLALAA